MAVDYNLVILGGSLVARHAAIRAAGWSARVALVEPPHGDTDWEREQLQLEYLQASYKKASDDVSQRELTDRAARLAQARDFAAWQFEQSSPAVLAAQGIDVVAEAGRFVHQPTLGVQVGTRVLRGHHYLVAVAAVPQPPPNTYTRVAALQQCLQPQLQSVAVWGAEPQGLVLAQVLQRLGLSVILATPAARLLPQEDQAIADLVQAQLEAEGVRVMTTAAIRPRSQYRLPQTSAPEPIPIPPGVDVQSGPLTLKADAAIACGGYRPSLSTLNLPAAVGLTPEGIRVNSRLQTKHPRIYACALSAGCSSDVAIAEAQVAVDNALSWPYRRVSYDRIPQTIQTDPLVVRVGLTAAQARKVNRNAAVLQQSLAPMRRSQLGGATGGQCQVVVSAGGTILGAYAVGPAAQEWIGLLSWAIARRLPLQALEVVWPSPAYGEAISNLVGQWRRQRRLWRADGAELLLNWRRDWTR